jgi:hypothetical protein
LGSSISGRSLGGLEGSGLQLPGETGSAGKRGAYLTSCRDIWLGTGDCGEQQGALIAEGNRAKARIAGRSAHISRKHELEFGVEAERGPKQFCLKFSKATLLQLICIA